MNDTIVALATSAGKSGVAVLRISGEFALNTLVALGVHRLPTPRMAHYVTLKNTDGTVIDHALVLYFPAPHSFTGEDIVEIQCHGSRAVIQELLSVLLSVTGIRYAEAGEFSRRALENGKMDLVQVEALMDLIHAETSQQKALAIHQLSGNMSHHYDVLERALIEARAFCEVFIDFPDDDLPDDMDHQINEKIDACIMTIQTFLNSATSGQQIREGVQVAIIGMPNAGKSTLINAIAGRQVAITSPIQGTTRDAIELYKDIDGVPYRFFDTAGIRETEDLIESQGVEIAKTMAREADIALMVLDGTEPIKGQLVQLSEIVSRETIWVVNKCDMKTVQQNVSRETFFISAKTGEGLVGLLQAIAAKQGHVACDAIYVTRERHAAHLRDAMKELYFATHTYDLVLKAEHLIQACNAVGYIVGKIHIERVLDALFSSFCIGK
jgi:tRNA modification GTPase